MKSALASLIKNIVLIGVLVASTLNFFYAWFSWQQLLVMQSVAGLAYLFSGCYEYLNAGYKAALPVQRYAYFTNSYLMFKVLKIAVFFGFAALLFFSHNRVKYLFPICIIIAFTETIITSLKYKNAYCFVNIYANYLLLAQDRLSKIFAADILLVEFRHNILYLVKKNNKSFAIKLDHITEKEQFINSLVEWLKRNNVHVSQESGNKLRALQESTKLKH
jgi:hypothetical protein